ncbi:BLUF domain-containing protein [Hymenobacter arizonensis]|uniref:Sensors of blue-light using FAD n=1 Tax=Hymenobacter arizonensis TaxID=1227077 RepID=A0A1I5U102_HYMAR|nr:BLUF domain-containing protein [Hymenobacter arizonensis]SFP88995.1 Sensors of blue-light using FAD [Hymenobacter arizonensis]
MQPYHLIYQSQWMAPMDAAALDGLLHQCRIYNQRHDITGVLLHTPEGRFLQVLEGARATVRHLYYHGILSDARHHHCQVLGEGSWPQRSFAAWSMGFRHAQPHDLRTLLGEAAPNNLGLLTRPYPRPQLLGLVMDFIANDRIPTWQEQ